MIVVTWEKATEDQYPIIAYRCFDSSLPVFKNRRKSVVNKNQQTMMLLDYAEVDTSEDEIESGERQFYRMRLPYTLDALKRRKECGGDIPIDIVLQNVLC